MHSPCFSAGLLGSFSLSCVVSTKGAERLDRLGFCLHFRFSLPPLLLAIITPSPALFHRYSSLQRYSKSTLSAESVPPA